MLFQNLARCPIGLCDLPAMLDIPYRILCNDDRLLDPRVIMTGGVLLAKRPAFNCHGQRYNLFTATRCQIPT